MEYQDGGPAFPFHAPNGGPDPKSSGLSLRDYFAAQVDGLGEDCTPAYAAEVSGVMHPIHTASRKDWAIFWAQAEAAFRYMKADAMLEARK